MTPIDAADAELLRHTAPADWQNPTPAPRYDLVVIGGGPAGLVAAHGAAGVGARVALVERGRLGGDCLIAGCVPSKALLASARVARSARHGAAWGVSAEPQVDFAAVMARMRAVRAHIAPADSAARLASAGVDVFFGAPRFTGPRAVEVGGQILSFDAAVIATGASAALPPIPGLADAQPLTNESLFELTALPRRLLILGAGVVGVEMATAFSAFGSAVTVVDQAARPLPRGDADASAVVAAALRADGVDLRLGARIERVDRLPSGEVAAIVDGATIHADAVLVALGRRPNLAGLGLDAAGVAVSPTGVTVDDHLRTTNPRVFAAGDVIGGPAFTHAADAMARAVIQNALFFVRKRLSRLIIPSAVYASPEVAQVGPGDLEGRPGVITLRLDHAHRDRLELDGDIRGFTKVHVDTRGQVLGATWVGPRAGDLIGQVALLMEQRTPIGAMASAIRPYPTEGEVLKALGDQWNRRRLTPFTSRLLRLVLQVGRRWRA